MYRAAEQQLDYMMYQIVKPYNTTVEVASRRIEILGKYFEYFPPRANHGVPATREQWRKHQNVKRLTNDQKQKIKYNLLPESYQERFDSLEEDWTEMTNSTFLAEAQKCT